MFPGKDMVGLMDSSGMSTVEIPWATIGPLKSQPLEGNCMASDGGQIPNLDCLEPPSSVKAGSFLTGRAVGACG